MKTFNIILISIFVIFLAGCGSMKLSDFENKTPTLDVKTYFNGNLKAYGLVKDRSGKIIKTFKAEMFGSWDEKGIGTLDEHFVYDNGEKQRRIWTFTPIGNREYMGTAG